MKEFEPVIVAFCCHYCAYTAADMAGSLRLSYPPNVKMIRVPCSGKVDVIHLIKAIEGGADEAYVAGCLEGDCHFKSGNSKAARRVADAKRLMADIGIEPERIEIMMMSAGMGERFAATAEEFTARIRRLGPNPITLVKASESDAPARHQHS